MDVHQTTRSWLSARADGEAADDGSARAHLAECEACSRWATSLELLTASTTAAADAEVAPDVTAAARELVARGAQRRAHPPVRQRAGRALLVLAGLTGLALAASALTTLPVGGTAAHTGLDLIGFKVAIAVGYLVAAVDPRRYGRGVVPVAATAAVLLLVPSVSTVTVGATDPLAEAAHLPVLAGLLGLVLLLDELRDGSRGRPTSPPAGALGR